MRLFVAIVCSCCVMWFAGCASHPSSADAHSSSTNSDGDRDLLLRSFPSYREALKFLAVREGLPADSHSLSMIEADSEVERFFPATIGELAVVRMDYRGDSQFGIRGAQGQGSFYAFRVKDGVWQLVGFFQASTLRWDFTGSTVRVFAHWHISAFDDPADDFVFIWNGRFFKSEKSPSHAL